MLLMEKERPSATNTCTWPPETPEHPPPFLPVALPVVALPASKRAEPGTSRLKLAKGPTARTWKTRHGKISHETKLTLERDDRQTGNFILLRIVWLAANQ
ncbi:Acetyl-hydrolase [Fusarium oxysporum f. sp. albedinis]|nr:Acetyl-hydrolase [Fusarium oxysporum f. sp. albedinis]